MLAQLLKSSTARVVSAASSAGRAVTAVSRGTSAHRHALTTRVLRGPGARTLSTATRPQLHVYTTDCTDPHWNLAYEEHLLRQFDARHSENKTLFIWRNEPTVVLGRYQNPWVECDLPLVEQLGAHLARRESGGGCVYHDLGNTNLTFFGTQHKPLPNLELIVQMLWQHFGVSATVTPRKDLAVQGRKVSGSAYRITGPRSYHHCTLLLDADLARLWRVLHPALPGLIDTKATESVRSHVTNLREHHAGVTHATVTRAMIDTFSHVLNQGEAVQVTAVTRAEYAQIPSVVEKHRLFTSWEWLYGNTPDFVQVLDHQFAFGHMTLRMTCKKAVIAELDVQIEPSPLTTAVAADKLAQLQRLLSRDLMGCQLSRAALEQRFGAHLRSVETSAYHFELIDFYNWLLSRVPAIEVTAP